MRRLTRRKLRGATIVEVVLLLPVVIGMTLLAADLFQIHLMRGDLEKRTDALASTLALQEEMNEGGLEQLLAVTMSSFPAYEMNIAQVQSDGTLDWWLIRGTEGGLCDELLTAKSYGGELPTTSADDDTATLIVVQTCISTVHLGFAARLLLKTRLQTVSISRQILDGLTLLEPLSDEAGIEDED